MISAESFFLCCENSARREGEERGKPDGRAQTYPKAVPTGMRSAPSKKNTHLRQLKKMLQVPFDLRRARAAFPFVSVPVVRRDCQ